VKLTIGLRPEVEGRDRSRNAAKTAGDGHWRVQSFTPPPETALHHIVAS
jgi:hypothetical protein